MVQASPPSPLREEDYGAIEAAVMETARGRWFLSEFAQRNRSADTNVLLDAIQKLDKSMRRENKGPQINRIQLDLADMQEAITRTKQEIAQIKHEADDGDRFMEASNELDAIISQTEGATQNILNTTEKIQELAWTLREQGVDEKVCDSIDEHSTDIYMACSFQDLTGQRTQKVVQVLRYLESRINEMMEIWGVEDVEIDGKRDTLNPDDARPDAHMLNGPQHENKGINQDDIDALMDFGPATTTDDALEATGDIIEHDAHEGAASDPEPVLESPVEDAATDDDAQDKATPARDDANDFTFIGNSATRSEEPEADVFASADAMDEMEASPEPFEVSGADVFSSGETNAALAEMVGDDDSEDDATDIEMAANTANDDMDEAGSPDDMFDAMPDDMDDAVSELETEDKSASKADVIAENDEVAMSEATDDMDVVADGDGLEEADADAMFEEMDTAEDDAPSTLRAGDDANPLSGLSTGERLALFS